jgi:branched-chain amino acid transport system permease protein
MVGSALAGLTGVLLAPASQLDPYSLTLVVLEILAVVVIARLSSPVGVVLAALALGVGQAELQQVQLTGRVQSLLGSLHANLFVVALLLGLLLVPRLAETRSASVLGVVGRPPRWRPGAIPAGLLLASPFIMGAGQRHTAEQVPGLALVFVSLVLLSGVAGQISLGAAGYAGLGAVLSAAFADPHGGIAGLPRPLAVLLAAVLTGFIGLITGYPALRRTGLALALTTLAVGTVASRFVFEQPFLSDLSFRRAVTGDRGYYAFEAACLLAGIGIVHILTSGPLGRALRAARDNADGARAAGVDVRSLTLLAFAVSAGIAGLGGALLTGSVGAFDAENFDPLHGLLWFTAVIVAGADSIVAAVVAAAAMTTIDAFAGSGASLFVVGLLATLLGRLPGGVSGSLHRLRELRWAGVRQAAGGLPERLAAPPPVPPVRPGAAQLSAAGRRLLRPEWR